MSDSSECSNVSELIFEHALGSRQSALIEHHVDHLGDEWQQEIDELVTQKRQDRVE